MDARALWILKPGQARIGTETLPEPGPGEVRVRARFGALSRGTEALVFQGKVPPSQHQAMRAPFQAGVFPGPVKYGYINVGTVEAGPEALLGRDVFCLFPHQTRYVVPATSVTPLPEGLPPERGGAGREHGDGAERGLGSRRRGRATGSPWSAPASSAASSPGWPGGSRVVR